MNKKITLTELLGDIEFYPDKKLKLYGIVYLDKINQIGDILINLQEENEKMKSIIKEAREYIEKYKFIPGEEESYIFDSYVNADKLLEILDKEYKNDN